MSGSPGLKCPECGREARSERTLLRTRRRWRWATLGVLLLLYAGAAAWMPDVRENGWAHRFPTWVLVRLYPWADLPNGEKEISVNRPVVIDLFVRMENEQVSAGARRSLAARCLAEIRTQDNLLRRRDAYALLADCGRGTMPTEVLIGLMRREADPTLQRVAWNTLTAAAGEDPAARALIIPKLLAQPNDSVAGLIKRLPDDGDAAREYVPALLTLMKTGTGAAPAEAAWKLMLIGPAANQWLPAIDEIVRAEVDPMRRAYLDGAAGCVRGTFASDAEYFASLLAHADPVLRALGAQMLCSFELFKRGHAVTEQLIAALENPRPDDDPRLEETLIEAVRMRGKRAMRAIPILERIAARPGLDPQTVKSIQWKIQYIRNHE